MRRLFLIMMLVLLAGCSTQGEVNTNNDTTSDTETATEAESAETSSENTEKPESSDSDKDSSDAEEKSLGTIPTKKVEILKDEREGIIPERIEIPSIDVDAPVKHLGLKENGEMEVPDSLHETSWYEPGYKVGAPGNSVIAGHVDDTVNPGVFKQLHTLEPGDEIIVYGQDGTTLTFTVYNKELFDVDEAPVDKIFGYSHNSLLNLITCEGPYNYDAGGTPNRWVIYTELDTEA